MKVYRAIENVFKYRIDDEEQNEYQDYLKGVISKPAKEHNHGDNTHNYVKDKHYIHFFHFKEDAIEYISNIPGALLSSYVAEYDIPDDILKQYTGFGLYPEHLKNIPVMEYAIPYEELDDSFITFEVTEYHYSSDYSLEYLDYLENYEKIVEDSGIELWWRPKKNKMKQLSSNDSITIKKY